MRADAASIALRSNRYICDSAEGGVARRFRRLSEKNGSSACGQGGELEIGGVHPESGSPGDLWRGSLASRSHSYVSQLVYVRMVCLYTYHRLSD
jgi:hypothetical protein